MRSKHMSGHDRAFQSRRCPADLQSPGSVKLSPMSMHKLALRKMTFLVLLGFALAPICGQAQTKLNDAQILNKILDSANGALRINAVASGGGSGPSATFLTSSQIYNLVYDSMNNALKVNRGAGGGGITSLNSLTSASQAFAVASSGCADVTITSSGSTHTFCIPTASASSRGLLTSTDWSTFNGKENALTFSAPLSRSVNTISCPSCELTGNKNAANGYAGLNASSQLSASQIPDLSATYQAVSAKNAANGYAGLDATSRIAKSQAPSTTVYTDGSNSFTAGTQDFRSAAVTRPFRALAFASFPASCTAMQDMLVRTDPATAGQVIYICNASGNGWVLVGDGGGAGAVSSVFGRTGAVVAQAGDYTAAQVTNAVSTAPSADQTIQGSADVSFIVKQANVTNT